MYVALIVCLEWDTKAKIEELAVTVIFKILDQLEYILNSGLSFQVYSMRFLIKHAAIIVLLKEHTKFSIAFTE